MPIYSFWYKKEITAPNLHSASLKEKRHKKLILDSISVREDGRSSVSAIGFEYNDYDEE